ncbi:MAG: hypothetical protein FWG14_10915 [Peptococcaceae bacterium]|nr:hypothetical protein [Peptococcaceae bacterium]
MDLHEDLFTEEQTRVIEGFLPDVVDILEEARVAALAEAPVMIRAELTKQEEVQPEEPEEPEELEELEEIEKLEEQEGQEQEELIEQEYQKELMVSIEPQEVIEPAEPAEPAELQELTESAEPVEPAEPAELQELTEPAEPAEPAELQELTESAEPAETAELQKLIEPEEPEEPAELHELIESEEMIELESEELEEVPEPMAQEDVTEATESEEVPELESTEPPGGIESEPAAIKPERAGVPLVISWFKDVYKRAVGFKKKKEVGTGVSVEEGVRPQESAPEDFVIPQGELLGLEDLVGQEWVTQEESAQQGLIEREVEQEGLMEQEKQEGEQPQLEDLDQPQLEEDLDQHGCAKWEELIDQQDLIKSAEPTEPQEVVEPTEPQEVVEPTEPQEVAEPTEPQEVAEPTEPQEVELTVEEVRVFPRPKSPHKRTAAAFKGKKQEARVNVVMGEKIAPTLYKAAARGFTQTGTVAAKAATAIGKGLYRTIGTISLNLFMICDKPVESLMEDAKPDSQMILSSSPKSAALLDEGAGHQEEADGNMKEMKQENIPVENAFIEEQDRILAGGDDLVKNQKVLARVKGRWNEIWMDNPMEAPKKNTDEELMVKSVAESSKKSS